MATITITFPGVTPFNYTITAQHIQRVLNVYDPSDSQTNEQTAKAIADGWVASLIDQVRAVEIDAAKSAAENAVIPITITPA